MEGHIPPLAFADSCIKPKSPPTWLWTLHCLSWAHFFPEPVVIPKGPDFFILSRSRDLHLLGGHLSRYPDFNLIFIITHLQHFLSLSLPLFISSLTVPYCWSCWWLYCETKLVIFKMTNTVEKRRKGEWKASQHRWTIKEDPFAYAEETQQ